MPKQRGGWKGKDAPPGKRAAVLARGARAAASDDDSLDEVRAVRAAAKPRPLPPQRAAAATAAAHSHALHPRCAPSQIDRFHRGVPGRREPLSLQLGDDAAGGGDDDAGDADMPAPVLGLTGDDGEEEEYSDEEEEEGEEEGEGEEEEDEDDYSEDDDASSASSGAGAGGE
jgi:hypothetical protein